MPEFHKLNKSRTTEISKEELNRRLKEEAERSKKNVKNKKQTANAVKRQQKLSEETKKQMPPQSPIRRQREQELKKQAEKEKKRRKHGSYIIYYILLGIIAAVIFWILSITVLFNCEKITVEGESVYSDEEIIAASGLTGTENLVRLNLSGINKRITDALVSLDSAEVTKQYPNEIKITVKAAEPMANFYYAGKNYVISHVGRVMQIESSAADCMEVIGYQPGESVIIGSYINAANPEQDKLITTINEAFSRVGMSDVTKLDISDTLSILITYQDRVFIRIGSVLQLDEKLIMAKEIIDNHIEPGERVTLDVTNTERVIQRPVTNAPEPEPVTEETDSESTEAAENPEPGEEPEQLP